jgi:hypothetical protein
MGEFGLSGASVTDQPVHTKHAGDVEVSRAFRTNPGSRVRHVVCEVLFDVLGDLEQE